MKYLAVLLLICCLLSCTDETAPPARIATDDPGVARLNEAIRRDTTDASLFAARASLWYEKENYDAAIADLQRALRLDSTNVEYHWLLSDAYLDYYRSRLSLRTLERAAALAPENVETRLRLAETRLILKQYDGAIQSLNEATRIDPRNPDAYLLLSEVFLETGDTARAIKSAEEATEIDPDQTDGFIRVGQLLAEKGFSRAGQYFDAAVSIDERDPVALHAKADYLRDQERLAEAIDFYRKASLADRQYVAGYFNAGLLLMELDSVDLAYREFDLVLKNDPIHIRAYFFRGYARELRGDIDGARADYKTALRFAPDYDYPREGLARIGGG